MDLATGLIQLASAAADRRHARRDLVEATEVVAREITQHVRTDDAVEVNGHLYRVERLNWLVESPVENATNEKPVSVLTRDGVALHNECRNGIDGQLEKAAHYYKFQSKDNEYFAPLEKVRFAKLDERAGFADEAADVIAAFRLLFESQSERYDKAASNIVKVRPR